MSEQFYLLVLAVLAVWRITHLFSEEDGPWDLLAGLRRFAGNGFWGGLLDCFYCLSLWVSAPISIVLSNSWVELPLLWLGLSGGAILLHRITDGDKVPPANYIEDPEE